MSYKSYNTYQGDFEDPYYKFISQEEAHTRRYCFICGWGNIPRIKLRVCDFCGNVCLKCQEYHENAKALLHHRPDPKLTIKIISDEEALGNKKDKVTKRKEPERELSPKRPKLKQSLLGFHSKTASSKRPAKAPKA